MARLTSKLARRPPLFQWHKEQLQSHGYSALFRLHDSRMYSANLPAPSGTPRFGRVRIRLNEILPLVDGYDARVPEPQDSTRPSERPISS